tara:strand:+ start:1100 stop:2086 length:987 start_codon:yes stop_codon:yes gene_type:complete
MADENDVVTEPTQKTVEPLDEESLADVLKDTLNREEEPEPQPEEQKEESKAPEDAPVSAGEDEGDVLSQEEETTEAEAEPTAEEGLTPEQQERFDKRIGKEVRKRKELEERYEGRIAELEAKLSDGAAEFTPQATEANPFANLNTVEDVEKEMLRAEQTLEWAEDNPDGAELTTKDGEQEYSAEQVRDIRRKAARAIRRQLPDQAKFIQERDDMEPEVLKSYPWWKDKASSAYQNAQMAMRQYPELASKPNYKLVIGDALAGQALRLSGKEKQKAKPVPKAPAQPTAPAAQPAPVDESTVRSAAARKSFQESGGVEELTALFAAQDKL